MCSRPRRLVGSLVRKLQQCEGCAVAEADTLLRFLREQPLEKLAVAVSTNLVPKSLARLQQLPGITHFTLNKSFLEEEQVCL